MATGKIEITEDSGWIYPLASSVTNVRYRKIGNVVYAFIAGWEYPTNFSGSVIFTLRSGFRPQNALNIIVRRHSDNMVANGWITAGGDVNIASTNKGETISMTVAFPVG